MDAGSTLITGGIVVLPDRLLPDCSVAIRKGRIADLLPPSKEAFPKEDGAEVIDASGSYVCPGFVDLHVHGGGGCDFMDGTPEAIEAIRAAHVKGGTTSMLLTTLTSSDSDLFATLSAFRMAKDTGLTGPRLIGIHLEGPYLSPSQAGAQDPKYLMEPDPRHYKSILDSYPEIRRVTAAPELPGSIELGNELRRRGISAAMGHTNATFDQVKEAVAAGFSHITHLYSAMSTVKRVRANRIAGTVEAGLLLDELTAEVIADGMHLPEALLKLAFKCKGSDKLALVTDAMRAAGMPDGEYPLGSSSGGVRMIVDEGVAWLKDRSAFAGSVSLMGRMVANMVKIGGVRIHDAVRMASLTPASMIGEDGGLGSIEKGKLADIVILGKDLAVQRTMVAGHTIFKA